MKGKINGETIGVVIVIIISIIMGIATFSDGDHAPGYGNKSKCTICGKPATHYSTNYGYCNKHWKNAVNYGK